jgi:hypothetical protein
MTPEQLAEIDPDMMYMEPRETYDSCIVGLIERAGSGLCVCYDGNMVLRRLEADGMTPDEAQEWMDYNIVSAYMGERTPAFLWPFKVEEDDPQTSDT